MTSDLLYSVCRSIRHSRFGKARSGLWRVVSPPVHRVLARTVYRNGVQVGLNGESFLVDYAYRQLHGYEEAVYDAFRQAIRPGMTVFDIGAHVGVFSLGAARRVQPSGKVVAFEPAPGPHRVLCRHLALNSCAACAEAVPVVVADADGMIELFAQGLGSTASLAESHTRRFSGLNGSTPVNRLRVESVRLDGFCAKRGYRPDVMKVDVEGAEFKVLAGARETLRRCRPTVIVEVHPQALAANGSSETELEALATELGYGWERLTPCNNFGIYHVRLAPLNP